MNTKFTTHPRDLYRVICVILVALLIVMGLPLIHDSKVGAAQFSQRSIQLSDAGASGNTANVLPGTIGSGTNVTYRVSFTAINTAASVVIDFCANNPIINDTCNAPTDMVATAATLNAAQITGNIYGGNGWTVTASASQIKLARDTNASHNIVAGSQVFELSGITNPSTTGSYYARMYSYQNNSYGAYASATSVANGQTPASGGIVDYGGIALSTSNTITITARVQETLTFCVTKAIPSSWTTTGGCDDTVVSQAANYPALTLGHNTGTGTPVLTNDSVDTATVYSQLSTNANSGAVINMHNSNTTCGGLSADTGATCAIPAVTDGSATAGYQAGPIIAPGPAAFGVYVSDGVPQTVGGTGVGTLLATPAYHNAAHTTAPSDIYYGMDTDTADGPGQTPKSVAGSVKSTYGSTVAYTTAPLSRLDTTYVFGATASLTTPAGIYTANLSMIATGTF